MTARTRLRLFDAHRQRMPLHSTILFCGLLAPYLYAQQLKPASAAPNVETGFTVPEDAAGLMTLHVYTNLIQMPALVLSPNLEPLPPIKPERFFLTLDGGPPYRPTKVRLEGDDPISLVILLDLNGAKTLIPKMDEAVAHLAPIGLSARDHVTIYSLHCGLVKTFDDRPADSATLREAMVLSLKTWTTRPPRDAPPCSKTPPLWDSIATVATELKKQPGRRIVLTITDGEDHGSRQSWQQVADVLQGNAITLFGIRAAGPYANSAYKNAAAGFLLGRAKPGTVNQNEVSADDQFETLSEWSGGTVFNVDHLAFAHQLAQIPSLIRGRYILEFPRPGNSTAGHHVIEVQVAKTMDFVRVSGTTVPLPDPRIASDPSALPSDPTLAPQMGKHKPLPPPD